MAVSVSSYKIMGDGDSSNVKWSIAAPKWIAFVSVFFCGTILICYAACLEQGHCGTGPWDSISHSWEHPPGSYASRFVVGTSCDMIAVFHGFLYLANLFASRQPNTDKKCCGCFTNEVLLGIGIFSVFCLSWVGAICDADNDPACLGNNTIHSTCAVLFFLLTDVVAGVLACDPKTEAGKKHRMRNMFIFIVMTLCTAVRACKLYCDVYVKGPLPQNGDNFVIIAEVIEVSFFLVFMNTVAQSHFTNMSWAVVTTKTPPSGQDLIVAVTAKKLVTFGVALVAFVLVSTYAIGEATNQVDSEVPLVGDLWVFKPNNWISRWGTVQAASAFIWVGVFSQLSVAAGNWTNTNTGLLLLQSLSIFALAGTGVVDKSDGENANAHYFFEILFFVTANLFAIITVAMDQARSSSGEKPSRILQLLAVVAVLSCGRYLVKDDPTTYAALEWVDMVAVIAFFGYNCVSRAASETMALAYLVTPPQVTDGEIEDVEDRSSSKQTAVKASARSEMGISLL